MPVAGLPTPAPDLLRANRPASRNLGHRHSRPKRLSNNPPLLLIRPTCEIDSNLYPPGIKVSDAEMQAINISPNALHGEWNYTIAPNQKPP